LINDSKDFFEKEETFFFHVGSTPHFDFDDVTGLCGVIVFPENVTLQRNETFHVGQAILRAATPLEEITVCLTLAAKISPV
jgi:hypothetical protein